MKTLEEMEIEVKEMKRLLVECGKAKGHEARVRHLEAMREKFPQHWMFQQEGTPCTKDNGI